MEELILRVLICAALGAFVAIGFTLWLIRGEQKKLNREIVRVDKLVDKVHKLHDGMNAKYLFIEKIYSASSPDSNEFHRDMTKGVKDAEIYKTDKN